MLPAQTLKKIDESKLCRFEIIYEKGNNYYIWSATVNTTDFSVAQRGVKFLNSYPKYDETNESLNSIG